MTHSEIEGFLRIIEAGSISKAAEGLYITQPALSRRIHTLEEELGYELFLRKKGIRNVELTEEGKAFITIAEKWRSLWGESMGLRELEKRQCLRVASVDSVSTYILPEVYQGYLSEGEETSLVIRTLHSMEAYQQMENGEVDLAFISDDIYSKKVETIPAFRENMCFISSQDSEYPDKVHPSQLDGRKQIRLPWNPEYERWHDYWIGAGIQPRVMLDKMSLLEHFARIKDSWAIVPASVAEQVCRSAGAKRRELLEGPSDRITYYLLGEKKKKEIERFLWVLEKQIRKIEGIHTLLKQSRDRESL